MRYTSKTEYALICMITMANHRGETRMTLREIADKEHYPLPYLEKILQALKRAGLVVSQQGHSGGHELARPASQITLKDVIDAIEGGTFDVFCNNDVREDIVCNHICLCGVKPVWRRTKELLDRYYGSITLEKLASDPLEAHRGLAAMETP